jgi:hypothetical protein
LSFCDVIQGLNRKRCTYLGHPLLSGTRVKRTASSRDKNFRVYIKESEKSLESILFLSVSKRLRAASLKNNDTRELLDLVFIDKDSISISNNSEV